jgi:hypothetical protein
MLNHVPETPALDGMEVIAAKLREQGAATNEYLKSYGQVDLSVVSLVEMILWRTAADDKDFHAWEAVAEVLGKDEDYARVLRRWAARIRRLDVFHRNPKLKGR